VIRLYLQQRIISNVVIVLAAAIFFSSFTLWLVESWIKYPLFIFEVSVIITIYMILNINYDFKFIIKFNYAVKNSIVLEKFRDFFFLDALLITSSSILIFLNGLNIEGGMFQLFLAFLCTSILTGYALLNIFKITKYFSKLEVLVLSYLLSFSFAGFSTLSLLSIDERTRSVILPIFFVLLGIISALRRRHAKNNEDSTLRQPNSLAKNIDIFPIALSIIFYLMLFYFIYPGATLLPGSDISRHYNNSIILSRTPDLYTAFSYILFHAFEATFHVLSGLQQTTTSFLTVQIILNVFLPISVYIFAKRFLGDLDRRIPAISTIFYTILSNFSFLYFVQLKLIESNRSQFELLAIDIAEKSYNGVINFLQPFHFFSAPSVSFILFMVGFILLKVQSVSKSRFVPLFSVLIFVMYLTHVAEALLFVILITVFSFISRTNTLRLDDAILSSLIGSIFISVFFGYTLIVWPSGLRDTNADFMDILFLILLIALPSISMLWRQKVLPNIRYSVKFIRDKRFYLVLSTVFVFIYLLGFLIWLFVEDFKTSSVDDIGVVPWFIYPLMLGIVGLLALLSIKYLHSILPNSSVAILLTSIVCIFLLGRVVSFVSLNFIIVGYWEKRFVMVIFLFVSLLAPIALVKFMENVQVKRKELRTNAFIITLISLIIISGFSSMALQYEYWFTVANSNKSKMSEKEFQATNYLKNILQHDIHAFTIAPSTYSRHVLAFAAPAYQFSEPKTSVFSKYPDIPLLTLAAHNLTHAYLYMHMRDFEMLKEEPQSWLAQHLIPMLPVVFSNEQVTIYNATDVSYPLPNSDTVMLIPTDPRENSWFYAYDIISQSDKNYTVMYDRDPNALKSKTAILSFDPTQYYNFYDNFLSSDINKWSIVSGKWKSSDGLHGGDKSNSQENIILSPVISPSRNLNTSTSFRITSADTQVPNYISIIYSWIDPNNYEYAGITIYNKEIYVHFTSVIDGKVKFDPVWPGLKTNLRWKPGNLFNMTLSMQGNSQELILNDTAYLHRAYNNKETGYLGLSYGRIQDVVFDYFKVQEVNKLNLRQLPDYITYAKSGGNLIVLNTNGQGDIANYLLNMSLSDDPSIKVRKLVTMSNNDNYGNISLLADDTNKLSEPSTTTSKRDDSIPSDFYASSQERSSIFAMEATLGRGKITYINIQPVLLEFLENKIPGTAAYRTLGKISETIDLRIIDSFPPNFKDLAAIFREMDGSGSSIKINTTSVIFPSNIEFNKVIVADSHHKNASIANITKLNVDGYRDAILRVDPNTNISLANGKGLYSDLTLSSSNHSSLDLFFINNATVTAGIYDDKSEMRFNNVSNIYILNEEPIHVYARQPSLDIVNGNVTMKGLYVAKQLYAKTGVAGQDLKISGNVSLSIYMSDAYTLASNLSIEGSTERVSPLSRYNEMGSFPLSISLSKLYSTPELVRLLSVIPFLIAIVFLIYIPGIKKVRAA
jgi:hypothetical protein